MTTDRRAKIAAFCRVLSASTPLDAALQQNDIVVFQRAKKLLKAGSIGPELEAALDELDAALRLSRGEGIYSATRAIYTPLPSNPGNSAGARWWTCPRDWCTGRGRVRPGQKPPTCAATGESLASGPFPQ
jgi:hypothetical protein